MRTRYRLDRDSFEALLANAFAVQKSGLDKESLAALVEIQQFARSEKFDFEEEMRMIADRVLKLSNASGVAIALLDANELVYCAGAGSAAKDIGRRVAAVLNISSSRDLRQEILRVEDAANDTRIEADICRQLGAMSLLMLPICEKGALKGILQVFFNDAHPFLDHEIRVYRMMAGVLEDGILRRRQQSEEHGAPGSVTQPCDVQGNSERNLQPGEDTATSSTAPISTVERKMFQGYGSTNRDDPFAEEQSKDRAILVGEIVGLETTSRTLVAPAVNWNWTTLSWRFNAALGAAVLLVMVIWTSSSNHLLTPAEVPLASALRAKEEPATVKSQSANQEPNAQRAGNRETLKPIPEFRRVRVSPNEVDDISEDVTIRRFTTEAAQPQTPSVVKEITLGDDVTVRYFANRAPIVFQPPRLGSESNQKLQHP